MIRIDNMTCRFLPERTISVVLVAVVCLCVVFQMLGAPVTLLGLLTQETPVELLSEDFSILPIAPMPGTSSAFSFHAALERSFHIPIFSTSVFHPPQG